MDDISIKIRINNVIQMEEMSVKEYAEKINFNQSNLSKIIRGVRSIPKSLISKMVDLGGTNYNWLVSGVGEIYNNGVKESSYTDSSKSHDEQLADRIQEIIARKGTTANALSKEIGYAQTTLSKVLLGKRPAPSNLKLKISEILGINYEWLEYGTGNMYADAKEIQPQQSNDDNVLCSCDGNKSYYKRNDGFYNIEVYHIPPKDYKSFANSASSQLITSTIKETYTMTELLKGSFISLEITNDSMDNGTRQSFELGDHVLCQEYTMKDFEQIPYLEHPYWAIIAKGTIMIKQIIADNETSITFHSLNDSPEYSDFTLQKSDISKLYFIIKKKPKEVTF